MGKKAFKYLRKDSGPRDHHQDPGLGVPENRTDGKLQKKKNCDSFATISQLKQKLKVTYISSFVPQRCLGKPQAVCVP